MGALFDGALQPFLGDDCRAGTAIVRRSSALVTVEDCATFQARAGDDCRVNSQHYQ